MTKRTRRLISALVGADELRPFTLEEIKPLHELVSAIAGRERALDPIWQERRRLGLMLARELGRIPAALISREAASSTT